MWHAASTPGPRASMLLPRLGEVTDGAKMCRVVARVRPLTESEEGGGHGVALSCLEDAQTVQIVSLPGDEGRRVAKSYSLDASVPPDASQVRVLACALVHTRSHPHACADCERSRKIPCWGTRRDGGAVYVPCVCSNVDAHTGGVWQGVFFDRCGIKPLLHSVLEGFAATCFAYGQTGSGKTYSLVGPESSTDKLDQRSSEHDGLLSRAVKFLFSEMKRREGVEHLVEVSYCEIYNEQVRDLLREGAGAAAQALPVRYNPHNGFYVEGLSTVACQSKSEVMRCFCTGFKATRVASHQMNARSNRSHCMFTIHVHVKHVKSAHNEGLEERLQEAAQVHHAKICFCIYVYGCT